MYQVVMHIEKHVEVINKVKNSLLDEITNACDVVSASLLNGKKIIFCGNGGSAADSQHLAAEFVGRFKNERQPLPGIALTVDSSALTAIGNDYGFDQVFSRQIKALANKGDVLIAISTSGNSPNVINAVTESKEIGCSTIGLLGAGGGKLYSLVDYPIVVPTEDTAVIQEIHICIGHIICENVDKCSVLENE